MVFKRLFCVLALVISCTLYGQGDFYLDNPKQIYAFRNADIIVSPEKTIQKGTLLIQGNKIISVGKIVLLPKEAISIDLTGKTIVPAFIESYASTESLKNGALLQKMGFGFAISPPFKKNRLRTAHLIATGGFPAKKSLLKQNTATSLPFFFPRKNSLQIGRFSSLRQLLYREEYYSREEKFPVNSRLETLHKALQKPIFFPIQETREILIAQEIADEFDLNFVVVGNGKEFEILSQLKNQKNPLILPIHFSPPKGIKDPYIATQIPLRVLKEAAIAPSNPYILYKNNIPFALTSHGHQKAKSFWEDLQQVLERGLPPKVALASLTTIPAHIFHLEDKIGTLEEGKIASFSVFNHNPFKVKEAKILAFWSLGKKIMYAEKKPLDIRGKYRINLPEKDYIIAISGSLEHPKGVIKTHFTTIDSTQSSTQKRTTSLTVPVNIKVDFRDAVLSFAIHDDKYNGRISLHGNYSPGIDAFLGQGILPNGDWIKWSALPIEKPNLAPTVSIISVDTSAVVQRWFPNMAYGFDSLTSPKTYVLKNATLWTNEKKGVIREGTIIIKEGKIDFVGTKGYKIPPNAIEIDCKGKVITSGIIDLHSELGLPEKIVKNRNQMPPGVAVKNYIQREDINIYRQLAGGVTTALITLGGTQNIGTASALLKLKWGFPIRDMLFSDSLTFYSFFRNPTSAAATIKIKQAISAQFQAAKKYQKKWQKYKQSSSRLIRFKKVKKPPKNIHLEALKAILEGEGVIISSSSSKIIQALADSFNFHNISIPSSSYGIIGSSNGKVEKGRRLYQIASKWLQKDSINEEEAWKSITLHPAQALHLEKKIGSLKEGKDADIVVWTTNPLRPKAKVLKTFIDGILLYDYRKNVEQYYRIQEEKHKIISQLLLKNQL